MPGNEVLPEHNGTIITRNLQEMACLFSKDLPFATTQRLLGWQTQEAKVLSTTELRQLVRRHGQQIRRAEAKQVEALSQLSDLRHLKPKLLVPEKDPRRAAAWPAELTEAVQQALDEQDPHPPEGVRSADWQRVLTARRDEGEPLSADELRKLGPEIQTGQILAATDDVLVRKPEPSQWLSLRVAKVSTQQGYRYFSGRGNALLEQLYWMLLVCGGVCGWLTLLGDGARWIRNFFEQRLAGWERKEHLLDWYHLCHKCSDFVGRICSTREQKQKLRRGLNASLWRGQVDEAIQQLEACRSQAKNIAALDELIGYLEARTPYIVNYQQRWLHQKYIGSAHAEKACDLIVARRQKNHGMHWSAATADALAALKTLTLNQAWDLYWQKCQVLPLAVHAEPIACAR